MGREATEERQEKRVLEGQLTFALAGHTLSRSSQTLLAGRQPADRMTCGRAWGQLTGQHPASHPVKFTSHYLRPKPGEKDRPQTVYPNTRGLPRELGSSTCPWRPTACPGQSLVSTHSPVIQQSLLQPSCEPRGPRMLSLRLPCLTPWGRAMSLSAPQNQATVSSALLFI